MLRVAAVLFIIFSTISNTSTADEWPPEELAYLLGVWEADEPNNRFHTALEWDPTSNSFYGYASKLGNASAAVGFKLGEHWLTIKKQRNGRLIGIFKHRWGINGRSTGFEWRQYEIDPSRSSLNTLWIKDETGDFSLNRVESNGIR